MQKSIDQPRVKPAMNLHATPRVKPIASAVALAVLALMETAHGQQAAAPAPATSTSDTAAAQLPTIVITANKRVEKLENVPMAISVMTDAVIKRNNVIELDDVINMERYR